MKVILKEDVDNLGTIGTVVQVSNGYGRNFLIPRNLAVEANPKNIKKFEHEKKIILEKAKKVKSKHEEAADKLSEIILRVEANAGEDGKLFGSVTSMDISEALSKQGMEVDKRKIVLPEEAIKRLGEYTVQIKLHPEISASIKLEVLPAGTAETPSKEKES
jgi:large subunit ribosomal protein L9